MRVLVTGGAGYIGSHTCVSLLDAGYEVAILDNLSNSRIEAVERIQMIAKRSVAFFNADVRNRVEIEKVFDGFQPNAVIHFAGLKAVGDSIKDPLRYYEWNVSGAVALLQVMVRRGVKRLVFSSSANVYGDVTQVPIAENSCIAPTNPYGRTKAIIEQILADVVHSDASWSIACLRYFNPMGAHQSGLIGEAPIGEPNNLPPYIAQVAIGRRSELQIFGGGYPTVDGTGVRDYIHVMDLSEGHVAALEYLTNKSGLITVNLGTGRGYSVLEMVRAFEKASGRSVPYRIVEKRHGDVAQSYADTTEAKKLLGWQANYGLDDMCRDAWNWQLMNPHGYTINN